MTKLLALLLIIFSASSYANTIETVEVTCPIGGEKFTFSTDPSELATGQALDLRPLGHITAPQPIPRCPANGYIVYNDFNNETIEQLKLYVLSEQYQNIQKNESNYYLLYKLAEHAQLNHNTLQAFLLRATWEANPQQYKKYANELLMLFSQPQNSDEIDYYPYLLTIELHRRLGNFSLASQHLEKFEKKYLPEMEATMQSVFESNLKQQKQLIRQKRSDLVEMKYEE